MKMTPAMAPSNRQGFLPNLMRAVLATILVGSLTLWGLSPSAIAVPVMQPNPIASVSSLTKEVTGKAEQDIGTVQKKVGQVTGQAEGTAKQIAGRAKQDIGRTQGAAEDLQNKVQDRASLDLAKTQQALDNTSDQVEETTESALDSIKDFFGQ